MFDRITRDRIVWRQVLGQLIAGAVSLGILTASQGDLALTAVPVVQAVAAVVAGMLGKSKVTPIDDPQTDEGVPLEPAAPPAPEGLDVVL